jgi:hypothetical protein
MADKAYFAHPTLAKFHASKALYRGIMGPRGSGKSTACSMEIMTRGLDQAPAADNIARSRFAVIRNTYRELEDTTVKTWLYWFDEEHFGPLNRRTMTHKIRYKGCEIEVIFRALDRPADVKKLLSMELTGAWVNEAREIPFGIIQALGDAVGRFPPPIDGGPTWHGVIMDTNPPDDSHWWFRLSELEPQDPKYWEFFKQPGGLIEREGEFFENPEAENLENLHVIDPHYYLTRSKGKTKDHIRVYYCNQYGFLVEGRPVHEEYVDSTHASHEPLEPIAGIAIIVGIDFGLTPAAAFGQILPDGRWRVIDELVTERMGIINFSKELNRKINRDYRGFEFEFYGDPAGTGESQNDEQSPFDILIANGIPAEPAADNNDPLIRREALYQPLTRLIDGKLGMQISKSCTMIRKALSGGYCYKKMAVVGEERYHEKPDKNRYSHIGEAIEYMALGGGEGERLVEAKQAPEDDNDTYGTIRHSEAAQGWMA